MSQSVKHRSRGALVRAVVAVVLGASALAVAPAADAASVANVRAQVHRADKVLRRVLGTAGSGARVGVPLSALVNEVTVAGKDAARLYRQARSPRTKARAARAIQMLTNQQNRDVRALTPLIGSVPGADQANLASVLATLTQGREIGLNVLAQLLGSLPAAAQAPIVDAVATLSASGADQLSQLTGLEPGSVVCAAADAFGQVAAVAVAAVQSDVTRLQSVLASAPTDMQATFSKLLSMLPDELQAFAAQFQQALACPAVSPTQGSGAAPQDGTPGRPPSAQSMFASITQFIGSMLQSFLPAVQSGQAPPSTQVAGPLGGLLGGLTRSVPGFGGLPGLGGLFGGRM